MIDGNLTCTANGEWSTGFVVSKGKHLIPEPKDAVPVTQYFV